MTFGFYSWLRSKAFATLFLWALWAAQGYRLGGGFNLLVTHPAFYFGLSLGSGEAFASDWRNIEAGVYRLPYDMHLSHRQYSPAFVADRVGRLMEATAAAAARAERNGWDEVPTRFKEDALYPEYYLRTFHWQSDGWLSDESAAAYEAQTEMLFSGAQDAMQRQALVPLHHWRASQPAQSAPTRLMDVACGTGRLLTFVADNHPDLELAALDLSPHYLAAARENLAYHRQLVSTRAPHEPRFLHANAESVPEADGSFDVLTCVYLFHELPPHARRAVAREMYRLLRPGGLLVLSDSVQAGDTQLDGALQWFPQQFHEPFYQSWLHTDQGVLFGSAGFEPFHFEEPAVVHVSKTTAWIKPR